MQVVVKKLSELSIDPANPRQHHNRNLDAIKSSLVLFGQQCPIIIDEAGVVLSGNAVLEAASDLCFQELYCIVSDLKTHAEKIAFSIAANHTSDLSYWHEDLVAEHMQELREQRFICENIFPVFKGVSPIRGA